MKSLILALLFMPSLAFGAVLYDNSATNQGDSVLSLTITGFAVAATNPLILCTAATANQVTTGVTFNTVPMTQVGSTLTQAGYLHLSLWKLTGQSGTFDAVFTFASDAGLQTAVACASFTGVDQATPVGTEQTGGDYENAPISITVPGSGMGFNSVASFHAGIGCSDLVPDSPQTERYDICWDYGAGNSIEIAGATIATTSSMSWPNLGGESASQIGVPINAASLAAIIRHKPIVMQ